MVRSKLTKILIAIISQGMLLASSSGHEAPHLDGTLLSGFWIIPFVGILLSIALLPLIAPSFWHHNFGKISAMWAVGLLIPFLLNEHIGFSTTLYSLIHTGLLEYIPFIILLLALFTISGGVQLTGSLVGTPVVNTGIILIGTILASWMGTTGAAMLLIRPLIRANKNRKNKVHIIVFFIFLVANIGGSLTPLGDPPLFLGFLKGVDFFWTTTQMILPMTFMAVMLITIFFIVDSFYYKKENLSAIDEISHKIALKGSFNLLLILGVIGAVLISGFWKPHIHFTLYYVDVELQNITRDVLLLILTWLSWTKTSKSIREENEFTWFPIVEVAKLFAGIFITIIPAIEMLRAGSNGALKVVVESVTHDGEPINRMYFWLTGILSSFLDNAPTYLVFFNTAGGVAQEPAQYLMNQIPNTLLAISAGAVFFGAVTYIGNAPNFMVKSISEASDIPMPSFFGYFFKYALPILFPLYYLTSIIFF
ncbi:MAG: sodium:proton antiporter [Bacteroidetes bacterium]|nr:sodium:proton antiporter [Bacteroidota bacterium]MBL7013574.1 sodium:proton antiporter [Candidatus Neomarinimicrobiota bacterium]